MEPLRIDPEFRDKIPPLTDAEFEQLKENILRDGEVYEPICVWNGVIVDGHNRWKIVQEHPEIPYRLKEMDFSDKWSAFDWMYKKQLGRRNLSDEQRTYLLGKLYEARKNSVGGNRGNQYAKVASAQNEHLARTADVIATEVGVGRETVKRAEHFAQGLDKAEEIVPGFKDEVLNGKVNTPKANIRAIRKLDNPEDVKAAVEEIINPPLKPKAKPIGNTKEIRERMKLADEVIAEMYSPEIKEFTIEMLESDIELNGMEYVSVLRNTLTDHSTMLVGDNRERVGQKIDSIINEIQKLRRLVE